jgi:hypothetical protein
MPLPGSVRVDRRILPWLVLMLAVWATLAVCGAAMAQPNPQYVLGVVIRGLQTGNLNQNWFGQEVLARIRQQTDGTFIYQNLVRLGPVQRIVVVGEQPMNNGTIYNLKATHPGGETEWQMGISRVSNRIEYLAVNVVGSQPTAPPPSRPVPQPEPRTSDVEPEPPLKPLPYPQSPPPYGPGPSTPTGIEPAPPSSRPPPPPPMPTPSPVPPGGGTGGSDACKLYPNLC